MAEPGGHGFPKAAFDVLQSVPRYQGAPSMRHPYLVLNHLQRLASLHLDASHVGQSAVQKRIRLCT
jgi:hypothetical protein